MRFEEEDFGAPAKSKTSAGNNRCRIEYAQNAIEQLAASAVQPGCTGTIGVEIPFKDGLLGKVKQVQVVLSRERTD